ncbi:hypothetical protein FHG87_002791 [Trinorchestia longiramus]|nr:hypothetical protein FHG87_002791 [Trinorchestia longiramus]
MICTRHQLGRHHQLGRLVNESACERKDPGSNPAADMVDAARNTAWDLEGDESGDSDGGVECYVVVKCMRAARIEKFSVGECREESTSSNSLDDIYDENSFDFGREINVDGILREIEAMGMRSALTQKAAKSSLSCAENDNKNCGKKTADSTSTPTLGEQKSFVDAIDQIFSSGTVADEKYINDNRKNTKHRSASLDYKTDEKKPATKKSDSDLQWDPSDIFEHLSSTTDRHKRAMEDSVADILEPVKGERQARLFYNFDRGSAFNTSVAFTIPLFSFTLPGAGDVTDDGVDGNVFGTLAFVSLFLLGGLAVAIYTTTQGAVGEEGGSAGRYFKSTFPGSQFLGDSSALPAAVYSAIEGFGEALDVASCSRLATCEAYTDQHVNSLLSLPFRAYTPLVGEAPSESLSPLEAAAHHAAEGGCRRKYPCIVDPYEFMGLFVDLVAGKFSS